MSSGQTIVLGVRHGEVHNPKGVIYAGLDGYGLSQTGRTQAAAVAESMALLGVTALYASPLQRALETAEVIAGTVGMEVVPDERLYEWRHWGQWAGITWEELRTSHREAWDRYRTDPGSVTEGESLAELSGRVASFLDDVVAAHPGGLVVAVSHLEPLRAALLKLTSRPASDLFAIRVGLGACVRLLPEPDPDPGAPAELIAAL